jgi:hemerythrin superfamily protein
MAVSGRGAARDHTGRNEAPASAFPFERNKSPPTEIPMDLVDRLKKTAAGAVESLKGAPDILDTLKREHDEVGEMLKTLVESESASERRALVKKIKKALVPHIKAEQSVVYDAVLALKDRGAKRDGEEGYLEHKLAADTLLLLGKISNTMSPEFSAASKVLKELVEHHVKEEEDSIWSDVKDNFSRDARAAMNRKFEAAKKRVRVA